MGPAASWRSARALLRCRRAEVESGEVRNGGRGAQKPDCLRVFVAETGAVLAVMSCSHWK